MDATTRWETEALRTGASGRPTPPRPTAKRQRRVPDPSGSWVTLREAEAATGIPVNTLRKWVRRTNLPSYLESDGETPVRMIDIDAVRDRAGQLGREIAPLAVDADPDTTGVDETSAPERLAGSVTGPSDGSPAATAPDSPPSDGPRPDRPSPDGPSPERPSPDTMIVPVDAWNKMLTQLGNLHEAGQQLADARERAAKAETEAAFLRRRLAEMRGEPQPDTDGAVGGDAEPPSPETASIEGSSESPASTPSSTSFLRYVAEGWRRRRRAADSSSAD